MQDTANADKDIRLIVPPSFEGVASVVTFESMLSEEMIGKLQVEYVSYIDYREYKNFSVDSIIVILGPGYKGYALPEEFYATVDIPFMDFIHFSTYGQNIPGNHLISVVDANKEPIVQLVDMLKYSPESSILSKYVNIDSFTEGVAKAVQDYRFWQWENNTITKVMLALYNASFKHLPSIFRNNSLEDVMKLYTPIIRGQWNKEKEHLEKKLKETKAYNVEIQGTNCVLAVVFSDQYINETANYILDNIETRNPIAVCVGRNTKGGDVFSVRTKGIPANLVAHLVNEGQGNENAASFFSDVNYNELMGNAIKTKIEQVSGQN